MKLTFEGTVASECFPTLWCECPICAEAKKREGDPIGRIHAEVRTCKV